MYQVLLACTIEYNARLLSALSVWDGHSDFHIRQIVYDGNIALEYLRNEAYDLVITELDIHGVDGLGLLRRIRQEGLGPLVVLLSDTVEFEYVRESLMFGAFDYLRKMPDAGTMLALLQRAKERLAEQNRQNTEVKRAGYPVTEEEDIVTGILAHRTNVIALFEQTFDKIYREKKENQLENDILVKEFYQNIINKVFKQASWLHYYVSAEQFQKLDYLWAGTLDGFKEYFTRKLRELQAQVNALCPETSDKGLRELILYVLNNPEGDLRLKVVAENVHLNYSYLSSNFSAKVQVHYSEFILRVRMARAAFLLESTDLLIYEICDALSYQDTNYFTRQFRKFYQVTPTAYREEHRMGVGAMDYSYL
ncbi:MAG: helix-turn-helix domain-containing protein [Lachnospiraceae bacterium]|nr:helix-turn-helix domain-containing protein [Lachnospiraceae bacterium]